jgi:AraC-like DNA-binding protein
MTAIKVISDRCEVSSLLAGRLKEHQVSVPAVLRRAGLPAGFSQQEKIHVTTALQQVTRELCTSTRTLQRRLTDAKISFQQLVEETRRELAHPYLRHSIVELNEAAFLLGYEDSNSFFRAFQGWEGTSPGEWRTRHRMAEAVA